MHEDERSVRRCNSIEQSQFEILLNQGAGKNSRKVKNAWFIIYTQPQIAKRKKQPKLMIAGN